MEIGETFTAQGHRWLVYEISEEGIVRSRAVPKEAPVPPSTIDYSRTCAYHHRGIHRKMTRCDEYVVMGTGYCKKHQHAPRYYVD